MRTTEDASSVYEQAADQNRKETHHVGTLAVQLSPAEQERLSDAEYLISDLDGTILSGDLLWESLLAVLGRRWWYVFLLPVWLLQGRAILKRELARRASLNVSVLPVRDTVIRFLREEKESGKRLVLATGADGIIARAFAEHLGIFDAVLASDGTVNLTGFQKKLAIQAYVRGKAFDYVGNAWEDVHIWKEANAAVLVTPRPRLLQSVHDITPVRQVIADGEHRWASIWQALRPQNWAKNVLLLVPIVMAHDFHEPSALIRVLIAMVSFSVCAAGVYILNDLIDLEADRVHPTKKNRAFASGDVPLWAGLALVPILWIAGAAIAASLRVEYFTLTVLAYIVVSTAYSISAKRMAVLDVLVLTALHLSRILAGGLVARVSVSPWLLAFSMFLLLSLAFTKRHGELDGQRSAENNPERLRKRDYRSGDLNLVQQFGVTSGYLAVLVLALYVNGNDVTILYKHPQVIWLACPLLLFWISRIWFLANRGQLGEDPVVFATRDPISYLVGGFILVTLLLAS